MAVNTLKKEQSKKGTECFSLLIIELKYKQSHVTSEECIEQCGF